MLLLDEPAAGLNLAEKRDLAGALRELRDRFGVSILLIDHDMGLVMNVCERIVVLDHGVTIAAGPPEAIRNDPAGDLPPIWARIRTRTMSLLEIEKLEVWYGPVQALRGISLRVDDGEVVALIGSNGAGKSTTLRTISGLLRPKAGNVRFDGQSIAGQAAHAISRTGVVQVPEGRGIFDNLTVEENLVLGSYSTGNTASTKKNREHALALFPILAQRLKQIRPGTLSGGRTADAGPGAGP